MNPEQFKAKWKRANLTERSASHQHFLDLCDLLGESKPAEVDPDGDSYTFEKGAKKTAGGDGWADVWKRGCFAWEYKGKRKDLDAAYRQLLEYREDLENPPLLVVCDMDRIQVHTNFTGTAKRIHEFGIDELGNPASLEVLRKVFRDPGALRPDLTIERLTQETSERFTRVAEGLRSRGVPPEAAAHFLMKLVFCFFAEDIRLLPVDLFSSLLEAGRAEPSRLSNRLRSLFEVMVLGGDFGRDRIAYFDGGLFADAQVFDLTREEIEELVEVSHCAWDQVEPSIFGTLFERLLDPAKRTQIGAHYTSRDDILTLIEPVLMAPLRREWTDIRARFETLSSEAKGPDSTARRKVNERERILQVFLEKLAHVRVLDPACGSGNFLYVAIHQLLDLEKEVISYAAKYALGLFPHVHPRQLSGIEINPYAQQLASTVIWIGYLQWMHHNGFRLPDNPVLEPLESIQLKDAIVAGPAGTAPSKPEWPESDVIVGNPPFLGGKQLRKNLGDDYVDAMFHVWKGRVPHEADLCCYWFEMARALVAAGKVKRAGLLATQGIRGGANRRVLEQIRESGDIFFAVSDRDWILDGANVHVSMIGFDNGTETDRVLDGKELPEINADLTGGLDITKARILEGNQGIGFMGDTKGGSFDIDAVRAREFLQSPNANGRSNAEVIRPWVNGQDITGRLRGMWIVDFGCEMPLEEAAGFEEPIRHVREVVKPLRDSNKRDSYRLRWWIHVEPRPAMRKALAPLKRYIATARLTRHRLFVFLDPSVLADCQIIAFAREDDYFFGVLHSAVHECWSRHKGTQLREAESGCRYTPTTCFETFPFPPLADDVLQEASEAGALKLRARIAAAAHHLDELRQNWLALKLGDGSPATTGRALKPRTLTSLYNERPTWLELAHLELDRAVLAAYGWPAAWAEGLRPRRDAKGKVNPDLGVEDAAVEKDVLRRLLKINFSRTEDQGRLPLDVPSPKQRTPSKVPRPRRSQRPPD
jgi:type II restriction/modification system DNA methylase subunit YeeA